MRVADGDRQRIGGVGRRMGTRQQLADLGQEGVDLGPNSPESVDYPDYAAKVASAVANHEADRGILIFLIIIALLSLLMPTKWV